MYEIGPFCAWFAAVVEWYVLRVCCCVDVIEVMFLCQMAAVASHVSHCPSSGVSNSDHRHNVTVPTADLILLRFKELNVFLCVDATDGRVRLKANVSIFLQYTVELQNRYINKRAIALYGPLWEPHHIATGRRMPYGIVLCYLPPYATYRAPRYPQQAGTRFTYPGGNEGRKVELT